MFRLLLRRDFGLLWTGGLVSVAGDWVLAAALPFFVYERTGSTVATAGMIAAELTPSVLLGSGAGVFVDRWPRKRLFVAANVLQAMLASLLILVARGVGLWVVYAVAAAAAAVTAFALPAESALLPNLVEPGRLVQANALNALNNRLGRLIGVPVGGMLLGLVGLDAVVYVDVGSFLVAAALISSIAEPAKARRTADRGEASFIRELGDGLRLVRDDRTIAVVFGVLGLMTFGGTMLDPLQVAWVRDVLGRGPEVYAWLTTTHAASGIVGSLLIGRRLTAPNPRALMGVSSVVAGVALLVRFDVPSLPLAFALSVVSGTTSVASAIGVETLVQQSVADEYRGRVFGSLGSTLSLLSLCGAMVGGAVGEAVGTIPALNLAAGLVLASGLVVLRAFRPQTTTLCPPR